MRDRYPALAPWIGLTALILVSAGHWRLIELPPMGLPRLALLVVVAVAPSAVALYAGRIAGLVMLAVSAVLALGLTSAIWPGSSGAHQYPAAVWLRIDHGAHDWFNATTPFDPGRFAAVDTDARLLLVLGVAALGFTVLLRRWALVSIGIALAIFAFPVTVVNLHRPWIDATMFLIAALIALRTVPRHSAQRSAGWGQAWALGAAVVVLGLTLSALPGVAKGAFLGWHTWDPLAADAHPRSLSYVWNQTYAPLHWRGKPTPVLNVWSRRPMYWRVATDEDWNGTAWVEGAAPVASGAHGQGVVQVPPTMLPRYVRKARGSAVADIRVQVLALADNHLVSAGQTLDWIAPQAPPFTLLTDGSARTDSDPEQGLTYSSKVYAGNPTPKQLASASGDLPPWVQVSDLAIGRRTIPRWPAATEAVDRQVVGAALLSASDRVWNRSGADSAPSVWAAAADVEQYFRKKPFSYDLTPKFSGSEPVLAQFMLSVHKGYCQMYSGSMALVLRLHGIPARVAVGFTQGTKSVVGGPFVVTDRDAHSWVEVYFPGYGWQPFDPTPTRHLPVLGSTSSSLYKAYVKTAGAAAVDGLFGAAALAAGKGTGVNTAPDLRHHAGDLPRGFGRASGVDAPASAAAGAQSRSGHGFLYWLLVLAVGVVALIGIVKFAAVRWRYLRRGPRAQASAAYRELSTFVGDQGVADSPERTFEELSSEIRRVFGVDASEFAEHASAARYAPPAQAALAGSSLRGDLRFVKRQIRAGLSRRDRVVGALRVRSTLAQITSLD